MAIQRSSLVTLAVDELIRLIIDRGLQENDALPSEADLADELDVSRTVVREAIAELAGQGLLERRQGRETLISSPNADQLDRLFRLRFAVRGADFGGLQEYRGVLEVGAARLAAERATVDDIESLRDTLHQLQLTHGGDELHERDQAFHREVARISRNDMILLTLDGISPLLFELRRHAWTGWLKSGGTLHEIIGAHEDIFDCIRHNDPAGADASMRAHLSQATVGLKYDETPTRADLAPDSSTL